MNTIISNIVGKDKMREVQKATLNVISKALENCFGPYASNSISAKQNKVVQYTKDGHSILKDIIFEHQIEASIKEDLVDITRYIVKTIGDGTTSAIILSKIIFNKLEELENEDITPYELIELFKAAVEELKKEIKSKAVEFTPDKAYEIALISTNGNKQIASSIKDLYIKYGNDVYITSSISVDENSYIKEYDGMTLPTGYCEECYINNDDGTCRIRNPKIYVFKDPIDTEEMIGLVAAILQHNIFAALEDTSRKTRLIPTVILTPRISRDAHKNLMEKIAALLFSIQDRSMRPPILIVPNIFQEDQLNDISRLCGCKPIQKYIDPKIQEKDVKAGLAPTIKTAHEFYGEAELIEADMNSTKFVNPKLMFTEPDKDGNREYSEVYNSMITFLEGRIDAAAKSKEDVAVIGKLKMRLNSLKSNMVEYLIGGISAADRDSLRALVEDAVLNCRSASKSGIGYGANFEGLRAAKKLYDNSETDNKILSIINEAYIELVTTLYSTAMSKDNATRLVQESLENDCPYNLKTKEFDGKVLSSIDSDIVILDCIAQIVTLIFTSNQFLCHSPAYNIYENFK